MKHHKLLEDAAQFRHKNSYTKKQAPDVFGAKFEEILASGSRLRKQIAIRGGCLIFSETQSDIDKHAQNIHEIEQTLSSFPRKALTPRSGPVTLH